MVEKLQDVVEGKWTQVVVVGRLQQVVVEGKLKQVVYVRGLLTDAGSRLTCCSLRLEGFGTMLLAGCKTVVGEVGAAGSD